MVLPTATIPTDRATTSPASCNERGNVVGLMPHPERAMSTLLGSADGRVLLESFVATSLARLTR